MLLVRNACNEIRLTFKENKKVKISFVAKNDLTGYYSL